jgi:predicted RNA-binding Zn-ribbon protein involved in translation (DUF1610 family)
MTVDAEIDLAATRIAERLCPRCGDPAAAGVQLCAACRELANERTAAAMQELRDDRRKRRRCADCARRSMRFRCARCSLRRKLREVLGGLIHTKQIGDSSSAVVHNGDQTSVAAHCGGAPTSTTSGQGTQ